jgi:hypothetical protein
LLKDTLCGYPLQYVRDYNKRRGMSVWHDVFGWLGGLPFEVAKPDEIFDFYKARGFILVRLLTDHSSGCNQFVFNAPAPVLNATRGPVEQICHLSHH